MQLGSIASSGGTIAITNGAGTINLEAVNVGNVTKSGTPTSGQIAEFTTATNIQGVTATGTGSPMKGTSPAFTSNYTLANGATPSTTTVATVAFDTDAHAASRGAIQVHDGTAETFVVATQASDIPTNGQVPTWNTGGTITWEAGGGGGSGNVTGGSLTANAVTIGGGSNAISVLASLGNSGAALLSAGAGAPPAFGAMNLAGGANIVTGLLPGANGGVALSSTLGTDDTYQALTVAGLNAGATIAQWEAVYIGGASTYLLADANGAGTYPARGLAVAAYSSTNAAIILREGTVRNDAWAWTPGGTIYLSTTAGGLTQTMPATVGEIVQQVGVALTADIAYFNFASGEYITVGPTPTPLTVYAAGTAYSLTDSDALFDFGTTDPTVTISAAGTYLLISRAFLRYNAATFVANQSTTIHLRRTNNTAADITNATTTATLRIITTLTDTVGVMTIPAVIYTTTNTNDSLSIYGSLTAAPSAGSVDCTEASIVAVRLY